MPWSPFDGSLPSIFSLQYPLTYFGGDCYRSNVSGDASLSCPLFINVEKT